MEETKKTRNLPSAHMERMPCIHALLHRLIPSNNQIMLPERMLTCAALMGGCPRLPAPREHLLYQKKLMHFASIEAKESILNKGLLPFSNRSLDFDGCLATPQGRRFTTVWFNSNTNNHVFWNFTTYPEK
jgi:hypothetical protein